MKCAFIKVLSPLLLMTLSVSAALNQGSEKDLSDKKKPAAAAQKQSATPKIASKLKNKIGGTKINGKKTAAKPQAPIAASKPIINKPAGASASNNAKPIVLASLKGQSIPVASNSTYKAATVIPPKTNPAVPSLNTNNSAIPTFNSAAVATAPAAVSIPSLNETPAVTTANAPAHKSKLGLGLGPQSEKFQNGKSTTSCPIMAAKTAALREKQMAAAETKSQSGMVQ